MSEEIDGIQYAFTLETSEDSLMINIRFESEQVVDHATYFELLREYIKRIEILSSLDEDSGNTLVN